VRLSALLTTYNRDHLLDRVLQNICLQTLNQSDYELVIIDDGSTDTSAAVVQNFQHRLPIRYFYQNNAGIAAARNHGLARARAPIVLLMDDDDVIEPQTLLEHLKSHEQYTDPEVAVLGFTKLEEKLEAIPLMSFVTKETGGHLFLYKNAKQGEFLNFGWFWGGRISFKRDYVLQSGGFNAAFHFGCEDIELGYRLSKRGLKIVYNPRAVSIMIRAINFDGFCRRLYLQGQSQRLFSQMYKDVTVQEWCEIPTFEREWPHLASQWQRPVERARRLDRCVEQMFRAGLLPGPEIMRELHRSYHEAFKASKLAGIAGAEAAGEFVERSNLSTELEQLEERIVDFSATLAESYAQIAASDAQIAASDAQIAAKDAQIAAKDAQIAAKDAQIAENLYHLDRINASPWWRFGMWFTGLVGTLVALFASRGSKPAKTNVAHEGQDPHADPSRLITPAYVRRVLVSDYRIPRADISAGERATVGILRDLCALGFEVVLLPGDLEPAPVYEAELKGYGVKVITRAQGYRSMTNYLRRHGHTFGAFYLIRFNIVEQVIDVIRQVAPAARVIFHAPDLYFLREMRDAELQNDDALRAAASRTREHELSVMRRADRTVLVSPAEVPFVKAYLPDTPISIFPALYALVADKPPPFTARTNLIFLAGFGHRPNVDAVRWFVEEIWPRVHAKLPEAQFHIVGAEAPKVVQRLGEVAGVKVIGFVPDLESILSSYRLTVAPLRYGAGIKGKLAMTMGAGIPCVCTSIAAEGMHIESGVHGEVADDAQEFADAVVRLYSDPDLWAKLSANGRTLIAENFSSDANRASLLSLLNEARALSLSMFTDYCKARPPRALPMRSPDAAVDVSIIVPVYNQWHFTRMCLNSILETTIGSGVSFEIILADDASTDETTQAEQWYPGLKVIKTEKNVGFLRNGNNAAKHARGRHLLLLNNDTVVLPGWLESLFRTLEQDDSVAIVGSKLLYPDGTIKEAGAVLFRDGTAHNVGRGHNRYTPIFNIARETDYISGASILVRKSFWDRVGGFDEGYTNAHFEASDLAMTARSLGLRVVYQPASEVVHFEHQSCADQAPSYNTALQRHNIVILREKWREAFARDHYPIAPWHIAMSRAERTAPGRVLARRRQGRFNILYFSPFQSHPSNHGNRATINQFASRFQSMGHKVHFVLLRIQECTERDVEDMRAAWDTFDHLPCQNPMRIPGGASVPFDGWYDEGLGERIRSLCAKYEIDVVFCSYVFQSKLLEFIPAHILKVIDTHDKMGDRYEMLRANGQPLEFFSCSTEEEGAYLRRADIVVARRDEEARYFDHVTGLTNALVIPHVELPCFLDKLHVGVANVGVVASANLVNLAMLRQCLEAIDQHQQGARCPFIVNVAGQVKDMIERLPADESLVFRRPWVRLQGYVPDIRAFYASVDLVLSPVTMGTGINVKTVQAMAYGMPLLSTLHGSKGIETGDPMHEHQNLASLVKSLFAIVEQPDELRRLATLSRERYARFYEDSLNAIDKLFAHVKLKGEGIES